MKTTNVLLLVVLACPVFGDVQNSNRQAAPLEYDGSVPKPTVSEIAYGTHARNVLDFWKAESDTPTPVALSFMAAAGEEVQRNDSTDLLIQTPY